MNKLRILFSYLLFCFLQVVLANNITGYEYWFDNSFADKTQVTVGASQSITVAEDISTASLQLGVHSFNVRFVDDSSQWSSVNSSLFIKRSLLVNAGANMIQKCYCWFDNDIANKQELTLTASSTVSINELISTATLTTGVHSFNCYFEDENAVKSSITSYLFVKRKITAYTGTNSIVRCQYWFDNDYSNATDFSITSGELVAITELISTATLSGGVHSINLRFQDEQGAWSSVTSSLFKKMSLSSFASKPDIIACEYWFDNEFVNRTQLAITTDTIVRINEQINISLPNGAHSLHFRCKDANGVWSSVTSSLLRKLAVISNNPNYIESYRYWVDDAIQTATNVVLPTPINPLDLVTEIDMFSYSVDEHLFHMQFKDTRGVWSSVTTDSISRNSFLKANLNFSGTEGCDSVLVSFTNLSLDADSIAWDFGDGVTSTELNPSHTYPATGNYTVQITARDTVLNLDSTYTVIIPITVHQSPAINLGTDQTICNYDSILLAVPDIYQLYMWNGVSGDSSIYAKNNEYVLVVTDEHNCIATDTVIIEFYTEPVAPVVLYQGDSLLVSNLDTDLQWYQDGAEIIGAIDTVYKPAETGDYYLVSTSLDGCYESSSNTVNVVLTAILEVGINHINLHPVPADDVINFSHNLTADYTIHIFDVNGQKLYQAKESVNKGQVNVSALTKGVYVFVIEQSGQVIFMRRFIKK